MKVKERESWVARNEGKGGKHPSYDQFNKAFKGHERNPKVKEFASMGLEEYHHYSERAEYVEETDEQKAKKKQEQKSSSSSNRVKNIVKRVVAAAAGAVIVVATYTTMTVIDSNNWKWSADNQTATVELVRSDGVVMKELTANITVVQQDPICNHTGLKTYTATATDEDDTIYTDTHYETLAALGHDLHIITTEDENGHIENVYECSRCHEQFKIEIDIADND